METIKLETTLSIINIIEFCDGQIIKSMLRQVNNNTYFITSWPPDKINDCWKIHNQVHSTGTRLVLDISFLNL